MHHSHRVRNAIFEVLSCVKFIQLLTLPMNWGVPVVTKSLFAVLLATTAFSTCAHAQQATQPESAGSSSSQTAAANLAQSNTNLGVPISTSFMLQKVTIVANRATAGGGILRAEHSANVVETVSRSFIAKQTPTANALALIKTLPSVNITNSDAFGLNGGSNLEIHGLSSADVGFLLDGIPVYNSGPGYSNEIIDSEDIESISLAPGTSNIDAPTVNSAGGTVYMSMRNPSLTPGGFVEGGVGTDGLNREYIRLDTGEIGDSGVRGFFSFSHTYANNWRGAGNSDKKHVDFKFLKDFSNGSQVALEGTINQQSYGFYYYPTASQFANYKADYSEFNTNSHYSGVNDTSYYKLNEESPPFSVVALSLPTKLVVSSNIVINEQPYVYSSFGQGTGATDLTVGSAYQGDQLADIDLTDGGKIPSTDGTVLVDSGFHERTVQAGNVLKVTANYGDNTVVAGWWYEHFDLRETDPVGMVNQATGEPYDILDDSSVYKLSDGANYYANDSNQVYQINSLFLGDTLSLLHDRLTLTAGLKDQMATLTAVNYIPGGPARTGFSSNEPLPQASVHFQIDPNNQIFADAEEDFRLPYTSSLVQTYAISSGGIDSAYAPLKPETAIKEELGYRYQNNHILADVSLFHVSLNNRLLTLNTLQNGVPVAETTNAGSQTSSGIDAQLATKPILNFSPYVSFEYLNAKIGSNIAAVDTDGNADYLPTKGKTQVMSPTFQAAFGLDYEMGRYFANTQIRYAGLRHR
jgi:iron complex outermembrane receptor protein